MGRKELITFRADCGVHLDENGRIVMWENQAMSDVIKAEDVAEEFIGMIDEKILSYYDLLACDIAAILNAAIDAGLVSPPVYCVRRNGELRKFDSGEVKVFSGKPWAHDTEHWKGQTE